MFPVSFCVLFCPVLFVFLKARAGSGILSEAGVGGCHFPGVLLSTFRGRIGDLGRTLEAGEHSPGQDLLSTEIRTLQRPGAPQGSTWTGRAGCSSDTADLQPGLETGEAERRVLPPIV